MGVAVVVCTTFKTTPNNEQRFPLAVIVGVRVGVVVGVDVIVVVGVGVVVGVFVVVTVGVGVGVIEQTPELK